MNVFTQDFLDDLNNQLDNALDSANKIHISVKQRTTRKTNTIIENLDVNTAIKKSNKTLVSLLKVMKSKFNCGGSIETDTNDRTVLVLQGDKKIVTKEYLKNEFKLDDASFVMHG